MSGVVILLGCVAAAAAVALLMRARDGRLRPARTKRIAGANRRRSPDPSSEAAPGPASWLAELGVGQTTAQVTLVQFSSAFCQPCVATRRILTQVTEMVDGVTHLEVDAESHLDLVRKLGILRTPTVLVLDRNGIEAMRATGTPRKADVIAAIGPLIEVAN